MDGGLTINDNAADLILDDERVFSPGKHHKTKFTRNITEKVDPRTEPYLSNGQR
jgi:hypothetical protein